MEKLTINIKWDNDAQIFVATCKESEHIYSQGRTKEEARLAFNNAAVIYFFHGGSL